MNELIQNSSNRPILVCGIFAIIVHAVLLFGWSKVILEESAFGVGHSAISGGVTITAFAPLPAPQVVTPPPNAVEKVVPPPTPKPKEFVKKIEKKTPVKEPKHVAESPTTSTPANNQPQSAGLGGGQSNGHPGVQGSGSGQATSAQPDYLRNPAPVYPRESRRSREEGTVLLQVTISSLGEVQNLALKKSSGFTKLDEAALASVRSWKFKPALLAGIAIDSEVEVPIRFKLK